MRRTDSGFSGALSLSMRGDPNGSRRRGDHSAICDGLVGAAIVVLCATVSPLPAQECHDWDADGASYGASCASATDCEDLAWWLSPRTLEACDGFDRDCNGIVDDGCARSCATPTALPRPVEVPFENGTDSTDVCGVRFRQGYLLVSDRVVQDVPQGTVFYARAVDRFGFSFGPEAVVGEPEIQDPLERNCTMASAEERSVVVWNDASQELELHRTRLLAEVLDRNGRRLTPSPIDLGTTSPLSSDPALSPWRYSGAVWTGDKFSVFWTQGGYSNYLLMTDLDREGHLIGSQGRVVTDDLDGAQSKVDWPRGVWSDGRYVLAVVDTAPEWPTIEPSLNILTVAADGTLLTRTKIPAHAQQGLDIERGGSSILVSWTSVAESSTPYQAILLDTDGAYRSDLGVLELGETSTAIVGSRTKIAWTGEEYAVVTTTLDLEHAYRRDWRMWRVFENGAHDTGPGTILRRGTDIGSAYEVFWDGEGLRILSYEYVTDQPSITRIACACGDADGDQFDACTLDCDDGDPLTNPLGIEACTGGKDEDCDGLVDCDDATDCPSGPGPGEVADLAWSDAATLAWGAPAGAQRYALARGLLSDLRRRGDFAVTECPGPGLTSTSWSDDGRMPPKGDGLYYVLRPEGPPCHRGSWSTGGADRDVTACR